MKYIVDNRYRTLNAIIVSVQATLHAMQHGRSDAFSPHLSKLQNQLPSLEVMKSPPFSTDQISDLNLIEKEIEAFLFLPEDLEQHGLKLLDRLKGLTSTIDPFSFALEDSPAVRRSRIKSFARELQIYLKSCIQSGTETNSSITEERTIIEDIIRDVKRISINQFTENETKELEKLFLWFEEYLEESSLEILEQFQKCARIVEKRFNSNKEQEYSNINEVLDFLFLTTKEASKNMTEDSDSFQKYTSIFDSDAVIQAVSYIKEIEFPHNELRKSQDNITLAFENGQLETGDSFASRYRAIDFYSLFASELKVLTDKITQLTKEELDSL